MDHKKITKLNKAGLQALCTKLGLEFSDEDTNKVLTNKVLDHLISLEDNADEQIKNIETDIDSGVLDEEGKENVCNSTLDLCEQHIAAENYEHAKRLYDIANTLHGSCAEPASQVNDRLVIDLVLLNEIKPISDEPPMLGTDEEDEPAESGELKGVAILQAKAQELLVAIEKERLYRISINKSSDRFYYAKQMVERLMKNQLID